MLHEGIAKTVISVTDGYVSLRLTICFRHFPHINTPKVLAKYVLLAGRRYLRGWMGFCSSVGENQTGNVAFRKLGQSTIN